MPCNCPPPFPPHRPPFMPRPEPFSPLPRRCPQPDPGAWIKEQFAAISGVIPKEASPDNLLADREWVARQAVGGKADKVADATEGNLAALTQDGNLADSGAKPSDFATAAQGAKADTAVQPAAIAGFVDGAEYDADYGSPPKPMILLKHGSEVVATVDATDFVIDGMVSNVEVKNSYLVITFNTDAGQAPIEIPLTDIFDPDNYYTKTAANNKFKTRQTPVQSPPTELTTTNAFIDTISQNANGVITPTKRGVATVAPASATDSGQVADALAVKNALAGKASTADATLTQHYTDWVCSPATSAYENPYFVAWDLIPETDIYAWCLFTGLPEDRDFVNVGSEDENATEFSVEGQSGETVVATRTANGYVLGSQTDKPLASEAEAEALRTGKLDNSQTTPWGPATLSFITVDDEPRLRMTGSAGEYIDITFSSLRFQIPGYQEFVLTLPMASGLLAMASDLNAKLDSTSAAPAFTAKIYAVNNLCTYNGVIYRCKVGYTATASSTKPNADTTHWEVKPASDLFLPLTGGTVRGKIWVQGDLSWGGSAASISTISNSGISLRDGTQVLSYPSASGTLALAAPTVATAGNLAALDAQGNPTDSGVKASAKLDASSASDPFSSDSSVSYPVGSHCTYNGKLYKCTTATTGGTWVAGSWTADTMTDPDAVLDITSQNQLRVVAKDGTVLWAQGYDLASTSSATLACDATNNFTFADGATTQAFTLPTVPTGKVGDFGLDIDNSANTGAATMTLTGLDTTFSVVVPKGESLNDMLAIATGELARFYISLSTFRVNNLPTWHIVKQVVENGGAQS